MRVPGGSLASFAACPCHWERGRPACILAASGRQEQSGLGLAPVLREQADGLTQEGLVGNATEGAR